MSMPVPSPGLPPVKVILLCLVAALFWPALGLATENTDEPKRLPFTEAERDEVLRCARAFISEVDKDDGDSWAHFSELAKKSASKIQWNVALGAMKLACGANVKRGNPRGEFMDRLPDAPAGRYFLLDLDSEFARLSVRERVVLVEEGKEWKIAGYFRFKEIGKGKQ